MKSKVFRIIFMLVTVTGLVSGCHHFTTRDDYRGYGSYRDSSREGRSYDSRREDWRNNRDDYRRRW